ncbi:hypothetical protein [Lagierella massiliensis]|uniref:hypothetical protein n=1 Tax=Lagierella massiliensis TaxID=1689303 RepID=UPI0006D7AC6D|nr:hypothetical protein [Lagierella massiliensis]
MKKSKILFHLISILLSVLLLLNYYKVFNKVIPVRGGMEEIVIALFTIYAMEKILNFIKYLIEGREDGVESFLDSLKGEEV